MSNKDLLVNIKKLREMTGVGFKDCKVALDETNGNIEKSIEFLRKKGIAKASKKMSRTASEGLALIKEKSGQISIIEINSETDFVAKNQDFINFCKELSEINFIVKGSLEKLNDHKMAGGNLVKDNLVNFIAKIGEKITLRRCEFFDSEKYINFSYVHSPVKKNLGKIGVLLSLKTSIKKEKLLDFGKYMAMHIAASSPLSIDKGDLDNIVLQKEKEIITEELKNSGKDINIIDKIATGKLNKFISDNTLLNQEWIMEPKKKVKDIIKEISGNDKIEIKNFIRFKVGEGV